MINIPDKKDKTADIQGGQHCISTVYEKILAYVLDNGCKAFDEVFYENNSETGELERIVRVFSDPNMQLGSNSFSFLNMVETTAKNGEWSDPTYYTVGLKEFSSEQNAAREVATYELIRSDPKKRLDVPDVAGPIKGENGKWYVFVQRLKAPVTVNNFMLAKVSERHKPIAQYVYEAVVSQVLKNDKTFREITASAHQHIPFPSSYNLLNFIVKGLFDTYPANFMDKTLTHNKVIFTEQEQRISLKLFEEVWNKINSHKDNWVYYRNCNGDNQLISMTKIYSHLKSKLMEAGKNEEVHLMEAAYDLVLEGKLAREELCEIIADSIIEIDMEKTILVPSEYDFAEFFDSYTYRKVFGIDKVLQKIKGLDREEVFLHLSKATKRIDNIVNVLQPKFVSKLGGKPEEARAVFYSEAEHYRELICASFNRLIETAYQDVRWYHLFSPMAFWRLMEYRALTNMSLKLSGSVYNIRVNENINRQNSNAINYHSSPLPV